LALTPKVPNKEAWRRQKEVYYIPQDMTWDETEEALSSSSAIFGVKNRWQGTKGMLS
jgi:hypothetical protein